MITRLELDFEFGKGQYQFNTTTPRAPGEPTSGCLEDPTSFVLECISELIDVLLPVRPSPDTSPDNVPQMFDWRQVWGLCWPWESRDSVKL